MVAVEITRPFLNPVRPSYSAMAAAGVSNLSVIHDGAAVGGDRVADLTRMRSAARSAIIITQALMLPESVAMFNRGGRGGEIAPEYDKTLPPLGSRCLPPNWPDIW